MAKSLLILLCFAVSSFGDSMETATARAFGDASVWKGQEIRVDAPSKVEEGFSYTDKITADERSRWGEARSMDMESDTDIERLKAREKSKSAAYQTIDESSQKRTHFRDVHKEDVWSNPELLKQFENPEEVFTRTFEDCKREPVYKTTFEKTLHRCKEGRGETHHRCTKYLKAKDYQKKRDYLNTSINLIGVHWDNGNVSYPSWWKTGHGVQFNRDWYNSITGSHTKPAGFTRFPKAEDPPDFLPSGTYYPRKFFGLQSRVIIRHNYKYYKREAECDAFGRGEPKSWIEIPEAEYDTIEGDLLEDTWVSDCEELEMRAKEGLCVLDSGFPKCKSESSIQRIGEEDFRRDCWQKDYHYTCRSGSEDTCSPLREQGCHQIASKCIEQLGPECVIFDVEMECLKAVKEPTDETQLVCGGAPYCMNGMCHSADYDSNKDMMSVMAKLKVLSQTAKHMSGDADNLRIFRGARLQCKKDMMSFRDCCNGGSGWGVGMNLAGCGGEEQTLAKKRSKGLCVEVGTYCAHKEKLTKICLTKKTSFCCFPTKLLRIIQQQGRAQLGIGWGDPEHSDCRGLTADELSRMDFSRLNLREVEADLMGDLNVEKIDSSLRERLGQIQEGISTSPTFVPSLMESSGGEFASGETHLKEEADG